MLQRRGIQHKVLNAKFHELEAEIVADWQVQHGRCYDCDKHGRPWYGH